VVKLAALEAHFDARDSGEEIEENRLALIFHLH
jgi:hypothetical protein